MVLAPRRPRRRCQAIAVLTALAFVAAALCLATPARAEFGAVELLGRAGLNGPVANGAASGAVVSADGRVVAFSAWSSTLAAGGTLDRTLVYVRDRVTGGVRIASRADGTFGAVADGVSRDAAISADGRFVAFVSDAGNLAAGVAGSSSEVYVRDLVSGTTVLVSRADGAGGAAAAADAYAPSISADGRLVAFVSAAGLVGPASPGGAQIYVRDVVAQTTRLVSRAADGSPATGDASTPVIAADGSAVAFAARGSANLASGAPTRTRGVFVNTLSTGATETVSVGADGDSWGPAISADGQAVAFISAATALSTDTRTASSAYLRDRRTGTTTLLSRATGAAGDGLESPTTSVGLSGDGATALLALGSTQTFSASGGLVLRSVATGQTRQIDVIFDVAAIALAADARSAVFDNRRVVFALDLADDLPSVIEPPRIVSTGEGDPVVGTVLRCDAGRWTNDPTFRFAWYLEGDRVQGADDASYTVGEGDLGRFLSCTVTARNDAGARSAETADVEIPDPGDSIDNGVEASVRFARGVFRAASGRPALLRLRAAWPGHVVMTVSRGGRAVAARRLVVRRLGAVAVPIRLPRGAAGWYRVTLRATPHAPVAASVRLRVRETTPALPATAPS